MGIKLVTKHFCGVIQSEIITAKRGEGKVGRGGWSWFNLNRLLLDFLIELCIVSYRSNKIKKEIYYFVSSQLLVSHFIPGPNVHCKLKPFVAYIIACVTGQLVLQQNIVLQVEATCCEKYTWVVLSATNLSFIARITTEASTWLATSLNSALMIGSQRSAVLRQIKN